MKICDRAEVVSFCISIGAPSTTIFTLKDVVKRLFNDGFQALENNRIASKSDRDTLDRCLSCSCLTNQKIGSVWCVDNDVWSKEFDRAHWGAEKPSADFFVLLNDNESRFIQFVEAKLGIVSGGQEKRPRHPRPQELYDKYEWSVKRIGIGSVVSGSLIVLFSNSVIEKMKNRFSRYNRENHGIKIKCMCTESYLESLEQGSMNHSCE
jgi:hypothetical protein